MNLKVCKTLILAACAALASCSGNEKGNITPGPGEGTSVYLKIDTRGVQSRADVETASGTTAALYTALVYFVDGETDPIIYNVLTAGPNGQIDMTDLEDGYLVEDVNSAVTQVYVVGNYNSVDQQGNGPVFPTSTGGRLSAVKDVLIDIQQVSYPAITGITLTDDQLMTIMHGQSGLQTYGANSQGWGGTNIPAADDLYANVVIKPMVARIEIEEIVYTGDLESFTLEGIYINNYFQKAPLSLDLTGYAAMNNGSNVNHYDVNSGTFAYSYYTTLFDTLDEAVTPDAAGEATIEPDNDVWAYQVFGNSSPVPHIILKLTDVVGPGGAALEDLYLTVTGFRAASTELSKLECNYVYKISSLAFSDEDLDPVPEPETVNIWVHVEVEEWNTVFVTPVL